MLFSIQLIAERVKVEKHLIHIHEYRPKKYSDVMLYSDYMILRPDILYISERIPENVVRLEIDSGLICIVKEKDFAQAREILEKASFDCLLLGTEAGLTEIFNEISGVIIDLRRQMDDFRTAVYTDQGLQKLIEMMFDILGNPAYLVDSSFKVLAIDRQHDMRYLSASWKRLEDDGYLPFDLVSNLINSRELSIMEADKGAAVIYSKYFYVPFINYNLWQHGKVKGHLFIPGMTKNIQESDLELTEYLGNYMLEAMNRSFVFQNARGDYYEHFMRDMFSGKLVDPDRIRQQMDFLGLRPEDYYTVIVIHTSSEHGLSDERIANQLERCSGAKPVLYNDKMAVLFSHGKRINAGRLQKNLENICSALNCEVGVSDTFHGFYDLNTHYIQAEWALTCVSCFEKEHTYPAIRYYESFMVQHLIFTFSVQGKWKALISPELFCLYQYDKENKSELVKTLYLYLQQERCVSETAKKLHIHRNTLTYRIEKIIDLCNFQLDNVRTRKRLLLSLEIMALFMDVDYFPETM